ncbi:hypothetical protein BJV78DRAFT_1234089 [Lactifluus subvellereus]|nr:hypothetical protein BJV78DRAFT_1234089 [Lactifluus subvellereus]
MVDSSESESGSSSDPDMDSSESGSSSDTDTVGQNTPYYEDKTPPSPLRTPKPRCTEDLQPEGCREGTVASTDRSVTDSLASIALHRGVTSDLEDVDATRRRVEAWRRKEATRIRLEQLQKQAQLGALQLRQRADDLEHENAQDAARLLREMEGGTTSTAMEEGEDGIDVQSNHGYTPTETSSSSDEDEYWSPPPPLSFHTSNFQTGHIEEGSPAPTLPATPPPQVTMEGRRQAQQGHPLSCQHAVAIPRPSSSTTSLPGAETDSFVVVTRQVVDSLNDLTGSPVRRTKRYRVRAIDLESICGDFDMEEL